MILWQERLRPSPLLLALSHCVVYQPEEGTPSRCTQCSSRYTALKAHRAANEATGISVIAGSHSAGSSLRHPNNLQLGL